MGKEIERKFVVDRDTLPWNLLQYRNDKIRQGYLAITAEGTEVRVRQKGDAYFLTVKGSGTLVRSEIELQIMRSEYEELWQLTCGRTVEKTRYQIPYKGRMIELDVYGGKLEGLVLAEIEFASTAESDRFDGPPWFGEEKTYDVRYKNRSLAIDGIPDEDGS
jgi:CYTH domain-containing protein